MDGWNFKNDKQEVLKTLAKRRNIYTLIVAVLYVAATFCQLIPDVAYTISIVLYILDGIFAGFGMITINNYRHIKSDGRKHGGGLWWFILLIFGLIIIPFLTIWITNKIRPLEGKVTGIKFDD